MSVDSNLNDLSQTHDTITLENNLAKEAEELITIYF